jgi:hypothetical protein
MKNKREQKKVADGDEEYESEHMTPLMPDAPRLDELKQVFGDSPSIERITARRDESEHCCYQTFISAIHTEPKRLQQPKDRPDDNAVNDTVSQPMFTLLKWICSCKE